MIIDNLHILSRAFPPYKTDAPLVVDPDRMLASAGALERLQPIAWRNAQVIQNRRRLNHGELVLSPLKDIRRKASWTPVRSYAFRDTAS